MSAKYVFKCAGCRLLASSGRRDTMTCSPACRIRAHRNGSLKTLRELAKSFDVPPSSLLHCGAIMALVPGGPKLLRDGEKSIDDLMPAALARFRTLLHKAVLAREDTR